MGEALNAFHAGRLSGDGDEGEALQQGREEEEEFHPRQLLAQTRSLAWEETWLTPLAGLKPAAWTLKCGPLFF